MEDVEAKFPTTARAVNNAPVMEAIKDIREIVAIKIICIGVHYLYVKSVSVMQIAI